MTEGLFQKAIAQSGTAGPHWAVYSTHDARKITLKFARKVGCNSEDSAAIVKCLRSKSVDDIIQAATYDIVSPNLTTASITAVHKNNADFV